MVVAITTPMFTTALATQRRSLLLGELFSPLLRAPKVYASGLLANTSYSL